MEIPFQLGASQVHQHIDVVEGIEQSGDIKVEKQVFAPFVTELNYKLASPSNEFVFDEVNKMMTSKHFVGSDSFYMLALHYENPQISLLKLHDAKKELIKFIGRLIEELDHPSTCLWKKLGFSRKKSVTIEQLKDNLSKGVIDEHVLAYIGKRNQCNVLRDDVIIQSTGFTKWIFFQIKDDSSSYHTFYQPFESSIELYEWIEANAKEINLKKLRKLNIKKSEI